MNKIDKIASILNRMQSIIGEKKWLSSIDTSLDLYIKNLPIILEYLKDKESINMKDEGHINAILSLCILRNKEKFSKAALRQRLNFYILLGFIKSEEKFIFSLNDLNWDFFYNDRISTMFIERSISIFKKLTKLSSQQKKIYIPCLRIFTGFYVYLLSTLLNHDEFNNIKDYLNEDTKYKFNQIINKNISNNSSNIIDTMTTTYNQFYKKYFSSISLEDVIEIGESIFDESINIWDIIKVQDNELYNSIDDKLEKIKLVNIEKRTKDVTNEKIKEILRSGFNRGIKMRSNNKSDIIIENIIDFDINFLEAAHIIPISRILNNINDLIGVNEDKLSNILKLCCSDKNGLFMPMNYHKFYDNGYIELSSEEPKFVLTDLGDKSVGTLKMLGYTPNHKINKDRYDEIIDTINKYGQIIKN